jgi:ABC-2 type transport system permease protein
MARGIRAAARRELRMAGYYLALLWSNGLMAYLTVAWAAGRLYRRGYNRLATGSEFRRRPGGHWLDRGLTALLAPLDFQTQLLIVKDFRTFRRDPAQWAQVLIFTGLIALYCTNVRRFFMGDIGWVYQNSISLLNLCAVALLLCTYTGRFIYPLLSLEGRRFWILGLLPLKRERLLWGQFAFSVTGTLLLAEGLIILSDLMLEMPWLALGLHVLTVGVLTLGLSGLSVGLGACMPNFRESDPSKIAVGFGGTLNLVMGLLLLVVVIGLMAGPWHAQAAAVGPTEATGPWAFLGVALGVLMGLGAGTAAVVVPLRLGAEALRRMEF